jgi:hypothetical protein
MGSISMPRLGIALWFANYAVLSLITYMTSSGGGRLPIFWTLIQATVWMAVEMVFLGLWLDEGKTAER